MKKTMKEFAMSSVMKKALNYISGSPDENLPKLLGWAENLNRVSDGNWDKQLHVIREAVAYPENNWYQYVLSLYRDIDREVLKTTFQNFLIHATMIGYGRQRKLEEELDCNIPWAILMDPTSACNLNCTGCWAAEYGNKLNMTYEQLDDIIRQANELGTYFFLYSGGEPLVRKKDLIRLCEAHPDC